MPISSEANISTADVLTLLWQCQLATAASIEELGVWIRSQGGGDAYDKALAALEALDTNATAIAIGITELRR